MLTLTDPEVTEAPVYPAYRPYEAAVSRILPLSPHFVRVTVTGDDLVHFGTAKLDQRIKLVFPGTAGLPDVGARDEATIRSGDWYARWRAMPEGERGYLRTYTVRDIRPSERELDIDFVRHAPGPGGADGPAGSWLRTAAVGDRLIIAGPDARCPDVVGIDWRPGSAQHLLLLGDETAAPAICSIIETLEYGTAQALIEVPSSEDILSVYPRGRSRISWLARDGGCETAEGRRAVAPHGLLLRNAAKSWLNRHTTIVSSVIGAPQTLEDIDVDSELLWDSPAEVTEGDFYAWVAGEAATVRDLRRMMVGAGVNRRNVAFMGYWREGKSETN